MKVSGGEGEVTGVNDLLAESQAANGNLPEQEIRKESSEAEAPDSNENVAPDSKKIICIQENVIQPHSQLPKPEPPPGLSLSPPTPEDHDTTVPSIKAFIKERSDSLSRLFWVSNNSNEEGDDSKAMTCVNSDVTEFNISGLKVVVRLKDDDDLKGRISFFSRSNCRDCTAVRRFLRQEGLRFVEINIDVYPQREKELVQRTGSAEVPRIFFNDKLFGGLVALNSLRNSGDFDRRLREMLGGKCSSEAPAPPLYGFDDPDEMEELMEDMIEIVRVLRQRLPIQDRWMKMKIVQNCFSGNEMVDALVSYLGCDKAKALEVGKQLAKKHFIHHVFGENDFEDGNHFYRFLEHEPYIPKCYNFRGSTNDSEPKPATLVISRLYKIMSAILESYASDDRQHVDYAAINKSEEFRRYVNLIQDLQRVDLLKLAPDEKLSFFLNLYNAMVIHAVIRIGCPEGVMDRRSFYSDFQYIIGGYPYSLNAIKNGILRNNRRPPFSFVKPFGAGDKRLEISLPKVNPLIHFGICNGTRSSPTVRFFTPQGIEAELRHAARDFFQRGGMEVNLEKRTLHLSRLFKWFGGDFGEEKGMVKWITNYLDATKAGLLAHLLSDGGPINIIYQDYDWSVNS